MSLTRGVGGFFALDIGTNAIRLVELTGDATKGWILKKYAYVPIDPKIAQDNSDNGRRKMGEAILGAVEQAGITTKNVAIGLPASKTYTSIIEVPNAPENELKKTIKYELDQYVPMALEKAQVDYVVLGQSPIDQTKAEVLVSSTASDYAEERMETIEKLGLNIIAQEPEPIAVCRALMPVGIQDARMIVDMGERSTDLVIVYNGIPRLVRSVPEGLAFFVKTVATALNVEEKQARRFILKFGLAQDKLDGQVFNVLNPVLENFAGELSKSVKFFQGKYNSITLGGLILTGLTGVIPLITEYIETKTGVPSVQGNPWQFVKTTPEQQNTLAGIAGEFSVAIGLAERSNE